MKRRTFIKNTVTGIISQMAIGGSYFQVKASPFAWMASKTMGTNDRILIIIQLSGGNDGLNTVPPLNQMSKYLSLRPNIGLAENTILPLGSTGVGFHPAMTGLKNLFDEKHLVVVQGLSYPNQSFSHFAATKIWNVGTTNTQEDTGWMGRFLADEYPTFPDTSFTDPIAIQVEDIPSTLFNSDRGLLSSAYSNTTLGNIINTASLANANKQMALNALNADTYHSYLDFINEQVLLSDQFAARIKQAGTLGKNSNSNYPNTNLSNKLKTIAKLINGGLQTKIYHIALGGFDTHENQLTRQNTLLQELSGAISAFQNDLLAMGHGIADRVTGMTFSEFGRRAKENTSKGTDHGTVVPMLVFGTQLNPSGMIGTAPDLNNLQSDNLTMQFDYRRAYAAFLGSWLGLSQIQVNEILLQTTNLNNANITSFEALPIFRADCEPKCVPATVNIIRS